ncbi:MAG: S41 family peptidase [Dehalococcoidia bacterium]
MTKPRIVWASLILVGVLLGVVLATSCSAPLTGRIGSSAEGDLQDLPPDFARLAEVYELLKNEHFDRENLDDNALSEGAIRGMLSALDDPYASFLNSEQYNVESQDFKGFFEGIGAQVGMRDGKVTIIAPLPDTPAERSGIKPGDVILEIDGESAKEISLLEAVSRIRGEKGTTVELLVLHLDAVDPVLIPVERGVIPLTSVQFSMLPGEIGHLRITNFSSTTNEEVETAVAKLREEQGVGLVLDLRNNPGGLLRSVVDVASQFLDDGLVLYEIDAHSQRKDWEVKSGGRATDIPMVVLVNQFSASASEVFSGAIMDHQRAKVVGTVSFGKGSVNTLLPLSDGSGVYFTIARWFTPEGTLIEGEGITPDVLVELPADAVEDVQLQEALKILEKQIQQGG